MLIKVTKDIYEFLEDQKGPNESFDCVLRRLHQFPPHFTDKRLCTRINVRETIIEPYDSKHELQKIKRSLYSEKRKGKDFIVEKMNASLRITRTK